MYGYGYPYGFYVDPTYVLLIIGMVLALAASGKMKSTFARYQQVRSHSGLTGAQTAQRILNAAGIYDVTIVPISGSLTDHYDPLNIRSAIVPVANIGSSLSWPIFLLGLIFSIPALTTVGIVLFSLAVLFQLVTLPVEFNASSRALKMLESTGILSREENKGAKKVLTAAALTYVAALASSILQLLRLLILSGGRRRDD